MNEKINANFQQVEEQLRQNEEIVKKYDCGGIYSISIGEKLVYIGKSRNMLNRLANHIFYIQHLEWTKSHKYVVLHYAKQIGHSVSFNVLAYAPLDLDATGMDEWLGQKEGELIREYLPPLNYQIPKEDNYHSFTVNRHAKDITLNEILGDSK